MSAAAAALRRRLAGLAARADDDFPPAEAALLLAALVRPGAPPPDRHLGFITALADELRAATTQADPVGCQAEAVAALIRRHRLRPDHDEDEDDDGDDLIGVIEARRGGADALGLLLREAARQAGLLAEGLDFPCHLLLRIEDADGRRLILDPLAGARPLDPPDLRALLKAVRGPAYELEPTHFVPLGNRALLVRLLNRVKLRELRLGRLERALAVVEGLLLVAPDHFPALWREAGLMHLRLDRRQHALAALEQFVRRTTNSQARARVLALIADLRVRPH